MKNPFNHDTLATLAYTSGWRFVRLLPEGVAAALFDKAADLWSKNGTALPQLRKNLDRVVAHADDALVKKAARSYARYWMEAFRLPDMVGDETLLRELEASATGLRYVKESYDKGKGVVLVLTHSGNWDMAGLWLASRFGSFTTVAERLKPEAVYQAFVDYRESLGFEVLPLTGGEPPFEILKQRLQEGKIVCLLGERDLKRNGVPVRFFNEDTTFPAGPAQLAIETGAALHVVHCGFRPKSRGIRPGRGWNFIVQPPIEVTTLEETVAAIAHGFEQTISLFPQDWHMLARLWPADRKKK
ncbi:MAG: phosphatidylinositol mannoside acyltransferase [Corynebacterium sp.]|nr:phosphatidylinositol mannoside acyltransferase [Corynebacterium sp.]